MIQGHGDDIFNYRDIEINFSSNVNPMGINDKLITHLQSRLGCLASYPAPLAEDLTNRIADLRELPVESLLVTNGAVEGLYLAASLLQKKRSLVLVPSFAEYEDACKAFQHKLGFCSDKELFTSKNLSVYDSVWLGNPNNPDGKVYDTNKLKTLIQTHKNTTFIIDEAYMDFTLKTSSLADEVLNLPNLIIICSMTKRFSIPGIRFGYMISHPDRIEKIKKFLMPWRINAMAIECGLFCLSQNFSDGFNVQEIIKESKRVQGEINALPEFTVQPSDTSFFLVEAPVKASVLKQHLATRNRLLIRDASNFRGLNDNYFRISIRTEEQNQVLINALKEWK